MHVRCNCGVAKVINALRNNTLETAFGLVLILAKGAGILACTHNKLPIRARNPNCAAGRIRVVSINKPRREKHSMRRNWNRHGIFHVVVSGTILKKRNTGRGVHICLLGNCTITTWHAVLKGIACQMVYMPRAPTEHPSPVRGNNKPTRVAEHCGRVREDCTLITLARLGNGVHAIFVYLSILIRRIQQLELRG
jgi:hypothetical protein